MKVLSYFTLQLSIWSVIVPFLAGSLWFKYLNRESRIVFWLVIAAIVPQVLTEFMVQAGFLNTLYNIYTPVEFLIIYRLFTNRYYKIVFKGTRTIMALLFAVFTVIVLLKNGISHRFLNEWVCAANLCYVGWIFIFILQRLLDNEEIADSGSPMFWYLCGLILYSPTTAMVFSFYYSIGKNDVVKSLWIIHDIFNTAMYLFFAIGMYKDLMYSRAKIKNKPAYH